MRNSVINVKPIEPVIDYGPPARVVLYFLSWSGFLVSFMMRNDINFAIVEMVKPVHYNATALLPNISSTVAANGSAVVNGNISHSNTLSAENNGEFEWSSLVQSIILSSFYWCYVLSQVAGGVATQYFGTKNVFGWSQFATAVCSLGIPTAASYHYGALIVLRSIQGFASGLTWPAMYAIVGHWIPPGERSRFMSSFQGFSIGIGLTYPLCGFIIANWGWRYVFYTTGTIGLAWCVVWYFLAFNTPNEHPRISSKELQYIELNVSQEVKDGRGMAVPWRAIFTSMPVWSIGITTFGRIWVHYAFIMGGPLYMKHILEFPIQTNGWLSGLPFICSYISSVIFCYIADIIVTRNILSLTNVRKLFTAISQIIPGILILIVGYLEHNIFIILAIWFVAVSLITASYAGAMASIVDIAPNLAGPVLAFAQTIHMTASFLSPIVTGMVVTNTLDREQWLTNFWITSVVAISTYVIFHIYGTAEIQAWNYPQTRLPEENRMLKEKSVSDE